MREGSALVEIEFTSFHPLMEPNKKAFPIQSGSVILDPDRFWCLRWCDLRCKYIDGDSNVEVRTELVANAGKFPIPKFHSFTSEISSPKEKKTRIVRTEFDLREFSVSPEDGEYYQSSFGLPEPVGITRPASPRGYIWIFVAALIMLGVAVLAVTLKRRYLQRTKLGDAITSAKEGRP